MIGVFLLSLALVLIWAMWWSEKRAHDERLARIEIRVQVNGIRGKSTVTRLLTGILQEAGFQTIGKTTGSAAKIILPNGKEIPIVRHGAPTVMELLNTVRRYTSDDTDAIVFETMALQPVHQTASQELLVKGNITVITNIREDHQDVMGETLEQIADTLSLTIPQDGYLITSEDRPALRDRLQKNAEDRNSQMIYADPSQVTDRDLAGFSYLTFRENVAIGLAIAELVGIPRTTAMRGMWNARPDIGVVSVQKANWHGKEIVWAPLFAVNDRESAIISVEAIKPYSRPDATRIGILNNRYDRADRAKRFAAIAAKDIEMDYWITFGAYEQQVTERMVQLGLPRDRIINLGFSVNPDLDEIIRTVARLVKGDQGLLVGMVNIHTPQAELIMEYFHEQPDSPIHAHEGQAWQHYRPYFEVVKERMLNRVRRSV
jgi:poly-gamma-glutamate synthase PgsB/CapB